MTKEYNLWTNSLTLEQELKQIELNKQKSWINFKRFIVIFTILYINVNGVVIINFPQFNLLPEYNAGLYFQDERYYLTHYFVSV